MYEGDINNTLNKTSQWLDNNNLKINVNERVTYIRIHLSTTRIDIH